MACAGLKECEVESKKNFDISYSQRLVNLAMDIFEFIDTRTWGDKGQTIILKIGLHYGPVIAGIIGHHKPQFSLIGDTVNTTSRICAHGEPKKLTISESIYNQIKYTCNFSFKSREIKVLIFLKFLQKN